MRKKTALLLILGAIVVLVTTLPAMAWQQDNDTGVFQDYFPDWTGSEEHQNLNLTPGSLQMNDDVNGDFTDTTDADFLQGTYNQADPDLYGSSYITGNHFKSLEGDKVDFRGWH